MNSRVKKTSLLIILLVIVAMMLTACKLNDTLEDKLNENNLVAKITYHVNGEGCKVSGNETFNSADIYYQAGSKAFNVGVDTTVDFSITRENYNLSGWYYPATNEDGSVKYIDKEKDIVELGNPFDFSTYVAKSGDEIDLYAKWSKNQGIVYVLATEEMIGNQLVYGEKTYEAGDVLKNEDFGIYEYIDIPNGDPFGGKSGYTFVGYYSDAECKTPLPGRVNRTGEEEDVKIYVKYLPSDWTVIDDDTDFANIFSATDGKYYIVKDLDGTKVNEITLSANATFSGIIKGNGHTIANFKFKNGTIIDFDTLSVFGEITSGAEISDITFRGLNVSFSANRKQFEAYFFASKIQDGAKISNVTIDGGTMEVKSKLWLNENDGWVIGTAHEGITVGSEPTKK